MPLRLRQRQELGNSNREKTTGRAVHSLGDLGYLEASESEPAPSFFYLISHLELTRGSAHTAAYGASGSSGTAGELIRARSVR